MNYSIFGIGNRAKLLAVEGVLTRSEQGIHKRIDENRELLELMRERAPEFLQANFWVEGWLRSQDRFLTDLLKAMPITNHSISGDFPRPWPGGQTDGASRVPLAGEDGLLYRVIRGGLPGEKLVPHAEVLDFIDACGIHDAMTVEAVLSGVPIDVDGADVRFKQVPPGDLPSMPK